MREPLDHEALAEEVADANFNDERLNGRLRSVVANLAINPQLSLPRVFDSAGLEATYRFLSYHRVMPELVLKPHSKRPGDEPPMTSCVFSKYLSYRPPRNALHHRA